MNQAINNAISVGINTRDMCGNEREAITESLWEDLGNKPSTDQVGVVMSTVNRVWRDFQKMANVPVHKIINFEERQQITNILESAK